MQLAGELALREQRDDGSEAAQALGAEGIQVLDQLVERGTGIEAKRPVRAHVEAAGCAPGAMQGTFADDRCKAAARQPRPEPLEGVEDP